jgi:hypothetical protein
MRGQRQGWEGKPGRDGKEEEERMGGGIEGQGGDWGSDRPKTGRKKVVKFYGGSLLYCLRGDRRSLLLSIDQQLATLYYTFS